MYDLDTLLAEGTWAIEPGAYRALAARVQALEVTSEDVPALVMAAMRAAAPEPLPTVLMHDTAIDTTRDPRAGEDGASSCAVRVERYGSVAVVPMMGPLVPRGSLFSMLLGMVPVGLYCDAVEEAATDPDVKAVVLACDSPGGSVFGLTEAAKRLRMMRGETPIVAVASYMAASAAYMLAAQADEIVASPSSMVGSVGTIVAHIDRSGALEQAGLDVTWVYAGKYKAENVETEPLTDDARAYLQEIVDTYYGQFVGAVAEGRGVAAKAVRDDYGQGRILTAAAALEAGLVDRVASLQETIDRVGKPAGRSGIKRRRMRAAGDGAEPEAVVPLQPAPGGWCALVDEPAAGPRGPDTAVQPDVDVEGVAEGVAELIGGRL